MAVEIKVLTLNCWGVFTPLACQLRNERMLAIGKELSKGEYDLVLLQEIWTQSDYHLLGNRILPVMPYTHYFHSNVFGTGVCVFSKVPILETFQHRYALNGYPHKVFHGDWFGGKALCLCRIDFKGVKINVYSTHMHAEYHPGPDDEYLSHRVIQALEMSQFIKHTAETCDVVIVGGDLNLQPEDLGCKLIMTNSNLSDAWLQQRSKPLGGFGTSEHPENSFTSSVALTRNPKGQRLDYLLFRSNSGYVMRSEKCYPTMGKVPDEKYSFSDHEGVAAVFSIRKNITAMSPEPDMQSRNKHFQEAIPLLDKGMKKAKSDQIFFFVLSAVCAFLLALTGSAELPCGLWVFLILLRLLLTLTMGFSIWMSVVMVNAELSALMASKKDVINMLAACKVGLHSPHKQE